MLHHPNCIELRQSFITNGEEEDEVYLNVVTDYIPATVHQVIKRHLKIQQFVPNLLVKLYSYQLLRSLAYIHAKGICHRDIDGSRSKAQEGDLFEKTFELYDVTTDPPLKLSSFTWTSLALMEGAIALNTTSSPTN